MALVRETVRGRVIEREELAGKERKREKGERVGHCERTERD